MIPSDISAPVASAPPRAVLPAEETAAPAPEGGDFAALLAEAEEEPAAPTAEEPAPGAPPPQPAAAVPLPILPTLGLQGAAVAASPAAEPDEAAGTPEATAPAAGRAQPTPPVAQPPALQLATAAPAAAGQPGDAKATKGGEGAELAQFRPPRAPLAAPEAPTPAAPSADPASALAAPAWRLASASGVHAVEHAPRTPARARDVAEQIAVAVVQAAEPQVELRLDPPELGRVQIRLTHADGGLQALVLADRPETQDFLRRHAEALQRELTEAGYADVSLEFAAGQDAAPRGQAEEGRRLFAAGVGEATPASPIPTPAPPGRAVLPGGLDIRL